MENNYAQTVNDVRTMLQDQSNLLSDSARQQYQGIVNAFDQQGRLLKNQITANGSIVNRNMTPQGMLSETYFTPQGQVIGNKAYDLLNMAADVQRYRAA